MPLDSIIINLFHCKWFYIKEKVINTFDLSFLCLAKKQSFAFQFEIVVAQVQPFIVNGGIDAIQSVCKNIFSFSYFGVTF